MSVSFLTDTSVILAHKAPNFVVKVSNSYRCLKQQTLNLRQNNSNETSGYLTISDLQFQAFKVDNSTVFGLGKYKYKIFKILNCI